MVASWEVIPPPVSRAFEPEEGWLDLLVAVSDEAGARRVGERSAQCGISAGDPAARPHQRGGPGLQREGGSAVRGEVTGWRRV